LVSFWRKPESIFQNIPRHKMDSGFRQNDTKWEIVFISQTRTLLK
jgi:hypothetical protein